MEAMGAGRRAFCHVGDARKAECDGGKASGDCNKRNGDCGCEGFGDAHCVMPAYGHCKAAFVGDGEQACCEMGDGERCLGPGERAFCEVGSSSVARSPDIALSTAMKRDVWALERELLVKASGNSTRVSICARSPACSQTIDCKTSFHIESDGPCVAGYGEEAFGNGRLETIHKVGGCNVCTVSYAHCSVTCRTPLYSVSEASCEVGHGEEALGTGLEALRKVGRCVCVGSHVPSASCYQVDCETPSHNCSEAFCGVGYGDKAIGNELEAFHVVGNGDKGCSTGSPSFSDVGNGESQEWVSPRISFSRDFATVDIDVAAPPNINTQSSSSRFSPEKRKWQQQDDYSSDFEFLRNEPRGEGVVDPANGFMLSADELFSDGKLLPLPFPNRTPFYDLCLPLTSEHHHQQAAKLSIYKSSTSKLMSRHLSFELSKPSCTTSHLTFTFVSPSSRSPSQSSHRDFPSPTVPGLSASFPSSSSFSTTSLSSEQPSPRVPSSSVSLSSSPSSKYSAKLKEIFKFKKVSADSPPLELCRDNSFTSTCRLAISPRSLWPFSRSGSVCEGKSGTTPLACKRGLDGAMEATMLVSVASTPSKNSDGNEDEKPRSSLTSETPKMQGPVASILEENSGFLDHASVMEVSNAEASLPSQPPLHLTLETVPTTFEDVRESVLRTPTSELRVHGSSPEVLKKKASVTSSFARSSPGRRGGTFISSAVKVNAGKIVLRNLERCSTDKKHDMGAWKGLNKRSSYSAAVRVSPVLNVAIYRGGIPSKNDFFGFGSLFTSKKNKKPIDAAINWRKGA